MSLDGIEVFAEVVNAQSFSRAAKRLGMPVSTVSAKVARLEERLGVTLLKRTTRKISVTEIGQEYHAYCLRALATLNEAEQNLAQAKAEPTGTLRITAPPDLTQTLLPPLIKGFTQEFAQMSVEVMATNKTVDLVSENVDLAIRAGNLSDSSLTSRKFMDVKMSLWAAPDYLETHGTPQSPEALDAHDTIVLSVAGKSFTLFGPDGASFEFKNQGRIIADDVQSCRFFIEAGGGIGLLPDFAGQLSMAQGQLVPILEDYSSTPGAIYFVFPAQRFVPQTVRSFIDWSIQARKTL